MNLKLKKCGDMYVYFDKEKNPLYAFEVDYGRIKKIHLMCDEMPEEIILPKIEFSKNDYAKISNSCMLGAIDQLKKYKDKKDYNFITNGCKTQIEYYAAGAVKVASGCFAGIKKIKLIAPVDYSIMLDWGCFDDNAEIELVLPKDMTLKQVYSTFDTRFNYEHENWTLISHKDFNYQSNSYCGIVVNDYKPEDSHDYKYTISKKHLECNEKSENQNKQKNNDKKRLHTTSNSEPQEDEECNLSLLEFWK